MRRLIGQDDDIERGSQLPGPNDRVHNRRVRHLPGVEHPARPALVDRRGVGAVQSDARGLGPGNARRARARARRLDGGRQGDAQRIVGWDGGDTHQERQRVRGDVVRWERRAAGVEAQVGIALWLEQRFRECRIGLPQRDDIAAGGEALRAERDGVQRRADLDLAAVQDAEQRHEADRVLMLAGNDVGVGPAAPAPHGPAAHSEKVCEPPVPVARRVLEQGIGRVGLVRHDVAQRPAPTRPGMAEVPGALSRIEAARTRGQLLERYVDGRREVGARRLGQDADAAVVMLVGARRRPGVVDRVDGDARPPFARQLPRHRRAERIHAVYQQGIDVGLDRVEVGRQEETRSVAVLLVDVVDDLRMPHVVDRIHDQLRLDLRERIPVAVVVVPGVGVIQLGRVRPFGRRPEGATVPVGDDRDPIGVERRHEPQNHVVEDRPRGGTGVAREPVREQGGRQVSADFIGVNPRRDEDDGLPAPQRLLDVLRALGPGVRELGVELPIAIQQPQVLGARDRERDERRAQRGVPQLVVSNAVARLGEGLVIADQGRPVGQFAILARIEAEHCTRRWDTGRGGGGRWRWPAAGRGRPSGRGGAVLRRGRRGQRNGDESAAREKGDVPHGGAKISRRAPSDHRRQGSLCSSTRRFCARPLAVLLGAT